MHRNLTSPLNTLSNNSPLRYIQAKESILKNPLTSKIFSSVNAKNNKDKTEIYTTFEFNDRFQEVSTYMYIMLIKLFYNTRFKFR